MEEVDGKVARQENTRISLVPSLDQKKASSLRPKLIWVAFMSLCACSIVFIIPNATTKRTQNGIKASIAAEEHSNLPSQMVLGGGGAKQRRYSKTESTFVDRIVAANANISHNNAKMSKGQLRPPHSNPNNNQKTLSLLYPAGLMGGFRNQAMRFIGLLKHAMDNDYDNILLSTTVWASRYRELDHINNTGAPRKFWPIPFDELFDVDHWNTFFQPSKFKNKQNHNFSFPILTYQLEEDITKKVQCWQPSSQSKKPSINALVENDKTKSDLPLLTRRMLFGSEGENDDETLAKEFLETGGHARTNFWLDPVEDETVEFLTGDKMRKKQHRVDVSSNVQNCTHPHVFGGKTALLWNSYLHIAKTNKRGKVPDAPQYQKLIETVDEALVPAKPWRILADRCVEHHLGLGFDEFRDEEEDPHAVGHDHGYIALHARVEPEMLSHKCGKHMIRNLTTILDLVELLSTDYNSPKGLSSEERDYGINSLNYASPISKALRQQVHDPQQRHRRLKGIFVAVARDELADEISFPKFHNITRHNLGVLNKRSVSYDGQGKQMYSESLQKRDKNKQQGDEEKGEQKVEEAITITSENKRRRLSKAENDESPSRQLPLFECGEGWVKHAFYESEERQQKLLTPTSQKDKQYTNNGLYGLYNKYGPRTFKDDSKPNFPLLPLPQDYFGDLLPSMLNFWLAVRADVFVGVKNSSWSTDVWTTRYHMGKGDRNFEYTQGLGIIAIGNGGLPPPHKNCK